MDVERLLISKILANADLTDVADAGITPKFFTDLTNRRVLSTILKHKVDYGEVPTVRTMKHDFPDFKFVAVDESLQYLIDEVRRNHRLNLMEAALSDAVDAYDREDADEVEQILNKMLGGIAGDLPNSRDVDITENGAARLERYEALKHLDGGLRGIPIGFPTIDRATQGLQKQQLITFIGPPKAGKSTMMLLAAWAAHRLGYSPLLIGFEMSNEEQEERLDAIAAEISHHKLRNGALTKDDWRKLEKSVHRIQGMRPFILSNDTQSNTTLTGVFAKVDRYKPDLLIVDGVYMMQDENGEAPGSPQALTNITRGFKRGAQNFDLPVIITTQVLEWKMDRKKGVTANSIGYSSSFAQDSDVIIAAENTDDPTIKKIKIVMARNAPPLESYVQWDWETGNFQELSENPFAAEGGDDGHEYKGADF